MNYPQDHIQLWPNILVRELLSNGISLYILGKLFALIDERSSVEAKLQQGYDPF